MNFDKKSLKKLLSLNDDELIKVLLDLGNEAGVDTKDLQISNADLMKIRTFLSMASEDDIARLLANFGGKNR